MNAPQRLSDVDAHELGRQEGLHQAATFLRGQAARIRAGEICRFDLRTRARLVDQLTHAARKVEDLK